MVKQPTHNRSSAGSIPAWPTIFIMENITVKTGIVKIASVVLAASLLTFGAVNNTYAGVQGVNTNGLSSEQIAQLDRQAQSMKSDPAAVSTKVRHEAEAWGELGTNMGKAMVGAARELGVAANEFAVTPLGTVVVGITAYKIIGRDLLGALVGSLILIFGYTIGFWMLLTNRWSTIQYEYKPILWGAFERRRILKISSDEDTTQVRVVVGSAILGITTAIALIVIF